MVEDSAGVWWLRGTFVAARRAQWQDLRTIEPVIRICMQRTFAWNSLCYLFSIKKSYKFYNNIYKPFFLWYITIVVNPKTCIHTHTYFGFLSEYYSITNYYITYNNYKHHNYDSLDVVTDEYIIKHTLSKIFSNWNIKLKT